MILCVCPVILRDSRDPLILTGPLVFPTPLLCRSISSNHITSPQWLPNLRPRPVYPTAIVVVGWKHRSAHTQFEQHLYLALAVGRFSSSSSSSSLGWQFLLLYRFASQNGSGGGRVEQGEDTVCCWGARVPAVSGGPRGIYYLFFHPTPALFIHD